MEKLKNEDFKAYKWLNTKPANNWSRSHFKEEIKCDILLNNLCEAFNGAIAKARDKPILTMLRMIMKYLMVRMANRRVAALKWKGQVGPRIQKIIDKLKQDGRYCIATLAGNMKYQVGTMSGREFVVDLVTMRWDLCRILCAHAMTCILRNNKTHICMWMIATSKQHI
ncbi:hypothetical protein ACFX13_019610 [Malus domestica]